MSRSELRDERHRLHCVDGLPMREIARRQGVQPSSVMRSIRVAEDHMDRPPRKQPRVRPRDFAAGMPIVQRAWDRGLLTERQLVTAVAVGAAPEAVALPPLLAEVLRELLTARHVEAVERARLWPARSGRAILALLLDAEADARSSSSGAHGAPTDG